MAPLAHGKSMKKSASTAMPTVYDRVQTILASARNHAARSVNTAQVVANWLIGREIVEEQQHGAKRAGYGEQIVSRLAGDLRNDGVAGYGEVTLRLCRQFYLHFPGLAVPQISYALRNKSAGPAGRAGMGDALRKQSPLPAPGKSVSLVPHIIETARATEWQPGQLHPALIRTHYRALLRISNPQARAFYEIESIKQNWNARELERQVDRLPVLCPERKGKTATCHRSERRIDGASAGVCRLRVSLGAGLSADSFCEVKDSVVRARSPESTGKR